MKPLGACLPFRKSNQFGFSLIELSAVISVAATVAVGFLSLTKPQITTNAENTIETQERIRVITDAMESFRVRQGRLPCPADPFTRSDNTRASGINTYGNSFGIEDLDTLEETNGDPVTYGVDCPDNIGSVPVNSLEIKEKYMFDAWGNRFTYHVSSNLCGSDEGITTSGSSITEDESRQKGCSSSDYTSRSGNIIVQNAIPEDITRSSAFVIISHGANGLGAFLPSGQQKNFSSASNEELQNIRVLTGNPAITGIESTTGTPTNIDLYRKIDTSTTFDDIVYYKTRVQIEHLSSKRTLQLLSFDECEQNSNNIASVDVPMLDELNAEIDDPRLGSNISGEQAALGIFEAIQNTCIEYAKYDSGTGAYTIDGNPWSPECRGTGIFVVSDTTTGKGSCQCTSGDWSNC